MTTDVIVWGFGKLGRAAAEVCLDSPGTSLVAVVTGRPDEADGLPSGVRIVRTLAEAASERPALLLHCGHAVGEDLSDLLVACAELGLDVVTSSGLFDPASQLSDEGARLHAAAVSGEVRIVTAGVQPGFVLEWKGYFKAIPVAPQHLRLHKIDPSVGIGLGPGGLGGIKLERNEDRVRHWRHK